MTSLPRPVAALAKGAFFLTLFAGTSFGAIDDGIARFSTPGVDRYADGTPVADGECYALVWSPAGTAFGGFGADGSARRACDRVVLAAPCASGGRCPEIIFQIPAEDFAALDGGTWSVCLLDTRNAAGVPTGVGADGAPRRVNRYGVVAGGIAVSSGSAGETLVVPDSAGTGTRRAASVGGAYAARRSAVPAGTPNPVISSMALDGGAVRLEAEGGVSFLSYAVESGGTLDALSGDATAGVADAAPDGTFGFVAEAKGESRFFRIVRAE